MLRKEIAAISELDNIKRDIDEVIENINSPLLVMVMGEFSRGKSTFINALVGQSIAMVDAKPTTAVITKLSYGEKDKITVFMRDGSVKNYDTDSFARLTAQGNDKSNKLHKKIDYVERTLPIDMLKSMSIIDSPGLNSINDVHEAATKRFMDKADTVIWLFDANDPCKQTEIDALKRLNPRLAPLVLVNKIDVIDEDEGDTPEKVLAKIERDLSNNKLEYQKIIGISAKMAFKGKVNNNQKLVTASNINEFYDAVETIIIPNREKYKRISMVDELAVVVFSIGNILNNKREENSKIKDSNYSAYIETEESLSRVFDELEDIADIVLECIDSAQSTRRKRLNPAEKSFYGVMHWLGLFVEKDNEKAQQYLEEAAVRNDAIAQKILMGVYAHLKQNDRMLYWREKIFPELSSVNEVERKSEYTKDERFKEYGCKHDSNIAQVRTSKSNKSNVLPQSKADDSKKVFRIVVLGEVSTGKSTFINALLGKRVIRAAKRPTTAIISKIVYGTVPAYRIFYKDKRQENVTEENFDTIILPDKSLFGGFFSRRRGLKERISFIDFAEIRQPVQFCKDNVELVDTPGLNQDNSKRCFECVKDADVVVIMLPYVCVSSYTTEWIQEVIRASEQKKCIFVISKRDILTKSMQEEYLITEAKKVIQKIVPQFDLKHIYFVNSKGAMYYRRKHNGEILMRSAEMFLPGNLEETGILDVEKAINDIRKNEINFD